MKTSYFWKALHEPAQNAQYVSISRQNMRGAENMPTYAALMPNWNIIKMAHAMGYSEESFLRYKQAYFEQLRALDANKVYNDLKDKVLVCFEAPKDLAAGKKFCHRRMVAGWIEEELGIVVPEETRVKEQHLIVPAIYSDTANIMK